MLIKILALTLFSMTSSFAYINKSLFFEDLLTKKYEGITSVEAVLVLEEHVSFKFKELAVSKKYDEKEILSYYGVKFLKNDIAHSCVGTIIKESDRLTVKGIPKEFQDRAGYVLLSECKGLEHNGPLDNYTVFPLNTTIPVGNLSGVESYRIYKKYVKTRPQFLCTDNDSNFEGIPRSQTTIHNINENLLWTTVISRSTPNSLENCVGLKCDQIENTDRALYFEDIDQGSVDETREFLNFLSNKLKGKINMVFPTKECIQLEKDEMNLNYCEGNIHNQAWSDNFKYIINGKEHRLVKLSARYESQKKTQLSLEIGNKVGTRDTLDIILEYVFVFSDGVKSKYFKLQTRYANNPLESQPECREL